jgi:hypothetical protein
VFQVTDDGAVDTVCQSEAVEIPEQVEIVTPKRFMDALRENSAKKQVRHWGDTA